MSYGMQESEHDKKKQSTDSVDVMTSLINGYELANGHADVWREKLPKEEDGTHILCAVRIGRSEARNSGRVLS